MSRHAPSVVTVLAILALALVAVPDGGHAATAAANGSADLVECKRGKQAKDRLAVFRGEMTQIEGATRMLMRFNLYEKVGLGSWVGVRAPGVNLPREARPGVTRFAYRQRVLGLKKGAAYRVGIVFRWYDADGKEVKHEIADSPVCRQPGKLPNPRIRDSIKVGDGPTPETPRYAVRVHNTGAVTVNNVLLRLTVDGAEVDTRKIGRLKPGQRRTVGFVGPVCRGEVVARIDPDNLIPEISERDNVVRTPCTELEPLPPG
jgi:CARDB protein